MNKSMIKIVLLVLTLLLIPATAVAEDSHKNKGYRGEKEYQNGKSSDDDDDDDYRGKKSRNEKHDDDDDGDDNNRGKRARRLLNKIRLHDTACGEVDGKWPQGLCYAYCEALDCDAENPRGSANACLKLEEKYQRMTGSAPPCISEVVLSCPCFGDLQTVFNTSTSSCSPLDNPTLIWDSSSGTQVQYVADTTNKFYACMLNNDLQIVSEDDANGCGGMIENFCALP